MLENFFNKFHNKSNFTNAINFAIANGVEFLARRILSQEITIENCSREDYEFAYEACVCELLFLDEGIKCT